MDKRVTKYSGSYRRALEHAGLPEVEAHVESFQQRLESMYASPRFREHDVYPSMNVELIYAVIAMCLELKELGFSQQEILELMDFAFASRRKLFAALEKLVGLLPNAYSIAQRWNISDHDKRVVDGSIGFDSFEVREHSIEYVISRCMYVEIFESYGIRPLCKIFCKTDEEAYANLTRHVAFTRHSDLSDGPCCHDVIRDRRFPED